MSKAGVWPPEIRVHKMSAALLPPERSNAGPHMGDIQRYGEDKWKELQQVFERPLVQLRSTLNAIDLLRWLPLARTVRLANMFGFVLVSRKASIRTRKTCSPGTAADDGSCNNTLVICPRWRGHLSEVGLLRPTWYTRSSRSGSCFSRPENFQ